MENKEMIDYKTFIDKYIDENYRFENVKPKIDQLKKIKDKKEFLVLAKEYFEKVKRSLAHLVMILYIDGEVSSKLVGEILSKIETSEKINRSVLDGKKGLVNNLKHKIYYVFGYPANDTDKKKGIKKYTHSCIEKLNCDSCECAKKIIEEYFPKYPKDIVCKEPKEYLHNLFNWLFNRYNEELKKVKPIKVDKDLPIDEKIAYANITLDEIDIKSILLDLEIEIEKIKEALEELKRSRQKKNTI